MASMTDKQRFYSDVIIIAVEDGIGWSYVRGYKHGIPRFSDEFERKPARCKVLKRDDNDDEPKGKWLSLDVKAVARAFKLIEGQGDIPCASKGWRKRMVAAHWACDADNDLDAGDADLVVQIALFGKVVYG